jgi:hypothetical protein
MKKTIFAIVLLLCASVVFAQQKAAPAAKEQAPVEEEAVEEEAPAEEEPAPAAPKGPAANAIALDVFPLLKGIIASNNSGDDKYTLFCLAVGYERLIASHFSIGVNLDLYFGKEESKHKDSKGDNVTEEMSGTYFSLAAEGRYYPLSESFDKLFIGATLGFNTLSIEGHTDPEWGGFTGLITSLKTGYKVVTPKNIYIEPSMSYVLSKMSLYSLMGASPLGWQGGLRVGYIF